MLQKYGGQAKFIAALLREIDWRITALKAQENPLGPVTTLYFGGGTPSLLSATAFKALLQQIDQRVGITTTGELTFEANPNGITDPPPAYFDAGLNRVSIGVQSLHDGELKRLSRNHNADQARETVVMLQQASQTVLGTQNISIDLMYGLPGQTLKSWLQTVSQAIDLGVQHISFYGLKVEENTPLARLRHFAAYSLPDTDAQDNLMVEMYETAVELFATAGFQRYEFSNLALPGYESRHNQIYWKNLPYIALGPGAHGYFNGVRTENVADLAAYCANPLAGCVTACMPLEQLENALIFGLRRTDGVDLDALSEAFGLDVHERFKPFWKKNVAFLNREGSRVWLKPSSIPVSNTLFSQIIN